MDAETGRLVLAALEALLEAVREARMLALGGEYDEGGIWDAEQALGRLADRLAAL